MQTFLPYPSFTESVRSLDNKRLGKQRLEAFTILGYLEGKYKGGWNNHPAIKMWRGYEDALKVYYNECVKEWIKRGFKNTMPFIPVSKKYKKPKWLGNEEFHLSHQSNLKRKSPSYYDFDVPDDMPYKWPV